MPSKFTENFKLNLWDASDKVLHDDFNEDNRKIDTALAGKLGRMEIIERVEATDRSFQVYSHPFPDINWNDWEYVCLLAQFPPYEGDRASKTVIYHIHADEKRKDLSSIGLPGMLVVFLPLHNSANSVSGFIISTQLTPFSCGFSYNAIKYMSFNSELNMYLMLPNILIFGGK